MDSGVTKYDIILFEEHNKGRELLKLSLILDEMIEKEQEGSFEGDFDKEFCEMTHRGFENMVDVSHYAYENAKDLNGIDPINVTKFLIKNRLSLKKFPKNYCSNIEMHTKILLMAMMMEDEGIDLNNINNIKLLQKIVCVDVSSFFDILGEDVTSMNPDNYSLITLMMKEDFSVSMLEQKDIDRLNKYHDNFIEKNVMPRVTSSVKEENRVLMYARILGYKAKGSF